MATHPAVAPDQAALTLEVDGDGVAWLVFDRPQSKVNLLTTPVMLRLDALLAQTEEGARLGRVKALVIRSSKPGVFIAGADVDEISAIADAAEGEAKAREGQRIFRRLEALAIPTIAAIDGVCLGGGTELALGCTWRIATDRPETRIGFPEVMLGILPGFGGTVRTPRLVGLRHALELILGGRPISARRAERIGLVDQTVPPNLLLERVRRLAWERIDHAEGGSRRRRSLSQRVLDDTAPGRRFLLWQARRRVLRETRGHYPAPLVALDTIRKTLSAPLEEAFRREAHALGRLITTAECKNLVHVFRLTEGAKKAAPPAPARPVERVAVLGAGVMGGGIAQLLAYRGVAVRLKDIDADALGQGLRHARELFDQVAKRGRISRREAEQKLALIAPTLEYTGLATTDLVIEAVVERMDVKQQVLREVEARARPDCVLTSNTSSLSLTEMQHALAHPENLCGMHFFNPVHRMPLVEIVRGAATSDETVATVFALVRRLEKTPLIVNDGPGFLVNRLLAPYLNEAGWLLAEGAAIQAIDRALLDFGMPMGPLRLLDEIGLDVARHVAGILYEAFGDRMRPAPALVALQKTQRLGKKGGRGFYLYEAERSKGPDETLYAELGASVPAARRRLPAALIRDRCVFAMVNEAARALEEGTVAGAGDVDLGMITGTGFPPFRGGLLRYADSLGVRHILERLEALEREHGPRFHPAALLREYVRQGRGFYGDFG